jgi:hypothetical protein
MRILNYSRWRAVNEAKGRVCTPDELKKIDEFIKRCGPVLKGAIDFWKGWVNNEVTKQKFKSAYGVDDARVNEVFAQYNAVFDKIVIKPFGFCAEGGESGLKYESVAKAATADPGLASKIRYNAAFVLGNRVDPNPYIYVNVDSSIGLGDADLDLVFVHEVQHIIYNIYPLNPDLKLDDCFTRENLGRAKSIRDILTRLFKGGDKKRAFRSSADAKADLIKSFGLNETGAETVMTTIEKILRMPGMMNYATNKSEFLSRVMTLRRAFGIKPGEDITLDLIKPTIEVIAAGGKDWYSNETGRQLIFILAHWSTASEFSESGYLPISQVLNNINELAARQADPNIKTV